MCSNNATYTHVCISNHTDATYKIHDFPHPTMRYYTSALLSGNVCTNDAIAFVACPAYNPTYLFMNASVYKQKSEN